MVLPLALALVAAQVPHVGPHAAQLAQFGNGPPLVAPQLAPRPWTGGAANLSRRVYGYLPSYAGLTVAQLRWDALTDVVLFSAGVSSSTGAVTVPSLWSQANVDAAHQNGGRAHLCATLFSSVDTFLANATARSNAISQLVSAVQAKGGDGVNIDFEFVGTSGKADFVTFITDLASALHAAIPGSEVTIAMPAYPPWDKGYDIPNLSAAADRLLLMEYDWHWQGGPTAGPVAPLTAGSTWGTADEDGVASYLSQSTPDKLAMGVPYYGYDWPTASETALGASTTASGTAVTYKNCASKAAATPSGALWDADSQTPWYHYTSSGQAHQAWYDDAQSLAAKYDYVNQQNLAGIMIWALGYEGSDPAPGDLIIQKFGVVVAPDAGTGVPDAGTGPLDAGTGPLDAGTGPLDAGTGVPDAGTGPLDAGTGPVDAGTGPVDAGTSPQIAGTGDVRPGTDPQIAGMVHGGCGTGGGFSLLGLLALGLLLRRR